MNNIKCIKILAVIATASAIALALAISTEATTYDSANSKKSDDFDLNYSFSTKQPTPALTSVSTGYDDIHIIFGQIQKLVIKPSNYTTLAHLVTEVSEQHKKISADKFIAAGNQRGNTRIEELLQMYKYIVFLCEQHISVLGKQCSPDSQPRDTIKFYSSLASSKLEDYDKLYLSDTKTANDVFDKNNPQKYARDESKKTEKELRELIRNKRRQFIIDYCDKNGLTEQQARRELRAGGRLSGYSKEEIDDILGE